MNLFSVRERGGERKTDKENGVGRRNEAGDKRVPVYKAYIVNKCYLHEEDAGKWGGNMYPVYQEERKRKAQVADF